MASLVREPNSPFWYLRYKDDKGVWRRKATPYRVGKGVDTRDARDMREQQSAKERGQRTRSGEEWGAWVDSFLCGRCKSPLTLKRYQAGWEHVLKFLTERDIRAPRVLTITHCRDYLVWRSKQKRGDKPVAHNTALCELKVLGLVMGEAVRREFAPGNPCRELGISREKPREKPALTNEQIIKIRLKLKTRPEWMAHAFEIAIHHGCRIGECRIPVADIDLAAGHIHFRKTKGDKPFTVPIHPGILPLILERIAAKAEFVCDLPKNAPKLFHQFFRAIGMAGVSFHCTRVTVATWMARDKSVPDKEAMRFLNHSSELVHRLYQRWRASDVSGAVAAVRPPPQSS